MQMWQSPAQCGSDAEATCGASVEPGFTGCESAKELFYRCLWRPEHDAGDAVKVRLFHSTRICSVLTTSQYINLCSQACSYIRSFLHIRVEFRILRRDT